MTIEIHNLILWKMYSFPLCKIW